MINPSFFFDTADLKSIKSIWDKLSSRVSPDFVLGCTTNPNALDQVKIYTLASLERHIYRLSKLISEIKGNDKGVIFIQIPNSQMSEAEMQKWIDYIYTLGDGKTKIGVKLTPFKEGVTSESGLNICLRNYRKIQTNITGIADAKTAIFAYKFNPTYISLIYGRIRKAGGDPKSEFSYSEKERVKSGINGRIIGGSMRDIETLKGVIETNAVPTIGVQVWEQINNELSPEQFINLWNIPRVEPPENIPVPIPDQEKLTSEFFSQMDSLGNSMYLDFKSRFLTK